MTGVLPLFANVYINIKISQYVMNIFTELFYEIGSYGPAILGILSIYLLWDKQSLFFYYIVGFFISSLINLVLKGLIQMPRPSEDAGRFNLALTHGRRFLFKSGMPYDVFGMPSGHAQSALYSCAFIYFSMRNLKILYGYLFLSLVTILQRLNFNYHTPLQVIVGAILGTVLGYAVYYMAKNKLVGRVTEKLDDFAPI